MTQILFLTRFLPRCPVFRVRFHVELATTRHHRPPTSTGSGFPFAPIVLTQHYQDKITLVKFGGPGARPCNKIDIRKLKKLEGQLPADVEVLKIDIDENPELATRYNIEGVPTMLIVGRATFLAEKTVTCTTTDQTFEWIDQKRDRSLIRLPLPVPRAVIG